MKKHFQLIPLAALSVVGFTSDADAAKMDKQESCASEPGVCYSEPCDCYYCLGPTQIGVNPAVRPKTCNGDFVVTLAGFYWNANQDGMEYAIQNQVQFPGTPLTPLSDIEALNNLIDANYENPNFKWDFGFKAGLSYNTTCDGWDVGVLWTWYRGKASSHVESEPDDNRTLIPLWSAFASSRASVLFASDIETRWKPQLNLIDIDLGREFWTSKYLTMRPFVGLRIAYIEQKYLIQYKGGSWSQETATGSEQPALNNLVELKNDFKGVGVRGGIDTVWHLGCGWAFFGNVAADIVYGRFSLKHDETNRLADDQHQKIRVLETDYSFRASRPMLDLTLGVQWGTMFCQCQYGLTVMLGWEHHLFFNQNQMWRVVRIGDITPTPVNVTQRNNEGENVFHQRRGDLATQGWTITVRFEF